MYSPTVHPYTFIYAAKDFIQLQASLWTTLRNFVLKKLFFFFFLSHHFFLENAALGHIEKYGCKIVKYLFNFEAFIINNLKVSECIFCS